MPAPASGNGVQRRLRVDITSALRRLAMLALLRGAARAMAADRPGLAAIFEHPATIAHGIAEA